MLDSRQISMGVVNMATNVEGVWIMENDMDSSDVKAIEAIIDREITKKRDSLSKEKVKLSSRPFIVKINFFLEFHQSPSCLPSYSAFNMILARFQRCGWKVEEDDTIPYLITFTAEPVMRR